MKYRYEILSDEGAVWARNQAPDAEVGQRYELELTAEQEKALVAAGWISERDPKPKKEKGG
jgi:hypothetical protein